MSGHSADAPSSLPSSKAISSLAKKSDITRQGTQKLKFVPTLPARRKKDEVKLEPTMPERSSATTERGRGRGRGESSGRGRGRGTPRPESEMTASGPFAMGPALAGHNAKRSTRSNFAPTMLPSKLGPLPAASLTHTAALSFKRGVDAKGKGKEVDEGTGDEVYSDPDEGVEIVDMENVRQMDWMAPEILRRERHVRKVKKEDSPKGVVPSDVDQANALDLSDSEEEEELEDIMEHFAANSDTEIDPTLREERLYFFQFPCPFPEFSPKLSSPPPTSNSPPSDDRNRKITLAEDVKMEQGSYKRVESSKETDEVSKIDGVIGRLEVYRSGAVKMRLANGILLDVTAATQPSFLQQAVYLDERKMQLIVLGEVNKRFSVSPNVEMLLAATEVADHKFSSTLDRENLISMDTI